MSWFRRFGLQLRQKATTARWLFCEFTGTEEEALSVEREAGKALWDLLKEAHPPERDRSVKSYVSDMGDYLARHVGARGYRLSFVALRSSSVNAFALPGGFIFVNRGLLEFAEWERDEIAFAVAHEIGHVVRRHARDRLVASTMKRGLAILARRPRIQGALESLCDAYVNSEYSQDSEVEADAYAAKLLIDARMNPLAGCDLFRRLDGLGAGSEDAGFLRSHPPVLRRIRHIESVASGRGVDRK